MAPLQSPSRPRQVTCGSSIKLQHIATKARLHSHQVAYSRGSQQQSVTGFPEGDDGNSLWLVQGPVVSVDRMRQRWGEALLPVGAEERYYLRWSGHPG